MVLRLLNQIQDLTTYSLFFLKLFSFTLIIIFITACEYTQKTIKIDDDLFLAPGIKNDNGCTQFSLRSKSGKPTNQALYTANKKGEYSMGEIKNCI